MSSSEQKPERCLALPFYQCGPWEVMCTFTSWRKGSFQANHLFSTFPLKFTLLPIIYAQKRDAGVREPQTQAAGPRSLGSLRPSPLQGKPEEACFMLTPPPLPPWLGQSWEWQESSKPLHTAAFCTLSRESM